MFGESQKGGSILLMFAYTGSDRRTPGKRSAKRTKKELDMRSSVIVNYITRYGMDGHPQLSSEEDRK